MPGDCPNCSKGFTSSCRQLNCPMHNGATALQAISPAQALQRYVAQVDLEVFDKGRLPTIAEWSAVVEMVGKLDVSTATASRPEIPDSSTALAAACNVVPFRRR